jgi:hypothetical protein
MPVLYMPPIVPNRFFDGGRGYTDSVTEFLNELNIEPAAARAYLVNGDFTPEEAEYHVQVWLYADAT